MRTAALLLAASSAVLFAWSYGAYPWLVRLLAGRRGAGSAGAPPSPEGAGAEPRTVDVLVAAADEEAVIGARIMNLLAQEPGDGRMLGVLLGCDGCRDGTAAAARAAGGDRVRVVEFPERRGKASVLNDLVPMSSAALLVFTDANTHFEPGAVAALSRAFADASVAAVCGRLVFEMAPGARETPESVYWDRETRLKQAEGALGVCLGANGGIYAARREFVSRLPEDTTSMDDFLIAARAARSGRRVAFAADAVAREDAARDVAAEVARRFRIGIGGGQVLRRELWLYAAPRHPLLTLAFLSRKAARWLAPVAALAAAFVALFAPGLRAAGALALGLAACGLAAARWRPGVRGALGTLYYFAVLNVALALGVSAGLAGYARPVWRRTARS